MKDRRILKNIQGYTLIELMTAAAIVAILAAIAIPNYLSYTASSRQAEAKIALSSIYGAEMNFAAEAGFYSACLTQLGYVPPMSDNRYYAEGFTNAAAVAAKCGPSGSAACNIYVPPAASSCVATALTGHAALNFTQIAYASNALSSTGLGYPADAAIGTATVGLGSTAFSAGAAGNISSSATNLDIWSINQNKALINKSSGI
jgi:prepilin-type N-terminal cleavage/methylation domain-containing protein